MSSVNGARVDESSVEIVDFSFITLVTAIFYELLRLEFHGNVDLSVIFIIIVKSFETDDENLIGFIDFHGFGCASVDSALITGKGVVIFELIWDLKILKTLI